MNVANTLNQILSQLNLSGKVLPSSLDIETKKSLDSIVDKDKFINELESIVHYLKQAPKERPNRVAFFALRELHVPILLPILKVLNETTSFQLGITSVPYKEGKENFPEEGLKPSTIKHLEQSGIEFWGTEKPINKYDCVVTADACVDRIEGHGPVVCVGHGTISKNIYFIDNANANRESFNTALCVPGKWYINSFGSRVHSEIVPTGFPKMDDMAKDYSEFKKSLFNEIAFSENKTTLLFAPTYNIELTGMAFLAEEWGRLDRNKYQVLVKLHGATAQELVALYRKICDLLPHFHFVEDQNLAPYLKISDILISDVSSAYVEGYAAALPVIVVNNPQMRGFSGYNSEAVEFKVRDGAYQLNQPFELHDVLKNLANGIDPLKPKRYHYSKELFCKIDGENSSRVAEVIKDVCNETIKKSWKSKTRFFIPHDANIQVIKKNLSKTILDYELVAADELTQSNFENAKLITDCDDRSQWVVLTGDHEFGEEWDLVYGLCSKYHVNEPFIGALFDEGDQKEDQSYVNVLNKRINGDYNLRRWYLKFTQFYNVVKHQNLSLDGLLVNKSIDSKELLEFVESRKYNLTQPLSGAICIGQLFQKQNVLEGIV